MSNGVRRERGGGPARTTRRSILATEQYFGRYYRPDTDNSRHKPLELSIRATATMSRLL